MCLRAVSYTHLAHISGIRVRFLPEPGTRLMEFEAGNVDILGNGCVFANELENLLDNEDYSLAEYQPPYPAVSYPHLFR